MPGIEMLGILEDCAKEVETFGVCCRTTDDTVTDGDAQWQDWKNGQYPHGWLRITV